MKTTKIKNLHLGSKQRKFALAAASLLALAVDASAYSSSEEPQLVHIPQEQTFLQGFTDRSDALRIEALLETYQEVLEQGCFHCGALTIGNLPHDYEYDHCIDICDESIDLAMVDSSQTEGEDVQDQKCSQIILTALGSDLVGHDLISAIELTEFADSLILDERSDLCFAYDPRDAHRRRLQKITDEQCNAMDCFDCARTAGRCIWDQNFVQCQRPPRGQDFSGIRWWQWFDYCPDTLQMCKSNAGAIAATAGGQLTDGLNQGNEVFFTIQRSNELEQIPKNYFCSWKIKIDDDAQYQLSIKRDFFPIRERLELNIIGDNKQQKVQDIELAASSPEVEWERFILVNTEALQIFAMNNYKTQSLKTFEIKLKQNYDPIKQGNLQQLTLLLMMVLLCCLCMAGCTVLLRMRCHTCCRPRRSRVNQDREDEEGIDDETRQRNLRMAAIRANGGRNADAIVRQVQHVSTVEEYKKLIPIVKFKKGDKEIDEFNTPECVICMEVFSNGNKVRKIPSCRHILHDECLMKWLSGAQMQEAQKCPMCNSDITVRILEKAIEEANMAKKSSKGSFLGLFGKSPTKPRTQQVNQPLPVVPDLQDAVVVQQEIPDHRNRLEQAQGDEIMRLESVNSLAIENMMRGPNAAEADNNRRSGGRGARGARSVSNPRQHLNSVIEAHAQNEEQENSMRNDRQGRPGRDRGSRRND